METVNATKKRLINTFRVEGDYIVLHGIMIRTTVNVKSHYLMI